MQAASVNHRHALMARERSNSTLLLEYFKKAIDWLRGHPAVDADRVAVFGMSRGGEAALGVAASFPSIGAVVASVPGHAVWQGNHPDQLGIPACLLLLGV